MAHTAPKAQGLYDPRFEHDACGIGAIFNISGRREHAIIDHGKQVLLNLQHRGAAGADESTGDGAGILLQLPHEFLAAEAERLGFMLPDRERYAVAMLFLPQDAQVRSGCQEVLTEAIAHGGLKVIRWRDVPTNSVCLGDIARASEPVIRQLFIDGQGLADEDLERRLFVVRKRAEHAVRTKYGDAAADFYVSSMSCRTIVYKGMFFAPQLFDYYPDLADPRVLTALAIVHQRYSTNTFPSWKLAHPFRMIAHNGEINTLRGNVSRLRGYEKMMSCPALAEDLSDLLPIVEPAASDSASFDNAMELLVRAGRSAPHALMMMIPEAFGTQYHISTDKRAFYEYHAAIMEPWDGPAALVFTDGRLVGGTLDRNGLRPCRYVVTTDGLVVLASEVGAIEFPPEKIRQKGRLQPGRMFLVDTREGRIVVDNEIKGKIARQRPYRRWLDENRIELRGLFQPTRRPESHPETLAQLLRAFGYTREDLDMIVAPMARDGQEPVGSMGTDTPLAVLSSKPKLLFNYFKQLFAQVTNPPIDPLREGLVMSLMAFTGKQRNLLEETPAHCRQLKLQHPILTNDDIDRLQAAKREDFKVATLPALFDAAPGDPGGSLRRGLEQLLDAAQKAIAEGASLLIVSDREVSPGKAPIPSLLATGALHHGLLERRLRSEAGIVVESGEPREVMHFCLLCGYGANAVNPYMAFEAIYRLHKEKTLPEGVELDELCDHYISAVKKGILKTMSKMGISTLRSYHAAQQFEAVGLSRDVVDRCFTGTASRIEGADLDVIARETLARHQAAFGPREPGALDLDFGGEYHFRLEGESHLWNPTTIARLQHAVIQNDPEAYAQYARAINDQSRQLCTLRGLFEFVGGEPVPLDEVEPASEIVKRFYTGAMSHGSISKEAHETLAIAMNRLGGRSNTGEGGEDSARFVREPNGDWRRSAVKQVASGRFGVTSEFLVNAEELQIKMAQGAKPGEGGQLPGHKVYPWIAKVRHSTPGVQLISPPPHHDIYSIEDLAQLIYDLKNANPEARVSVKLVAEIGVGTVAAGVSKAHADVVLISGHDGGTGASPLTAIKHSGVPWELGLAETQQVLVLNRLRDRIIVQTDGQLKTGRDVVIAALLGAEEFGFATAPLVVMGCVMMRVCHLNTCPVGVATQDPELRKRFTGKPEYVERFFRFIAQEVREYMAQLGFRTVNEMIGRSDRLETRQAVEHWKAKGLDFSKILARPEVGPDVAVRRVVAQDHGLDRALDHALVARCADALEHGTPVALELPIKNVNRTVGTILGYHVTKRYGGRGLPDDTIRIRFTGSAGQSFGAFVPRGITMVLEGDANDYFGKGLSGGRLIVFPPLVSAFPAEENILVGNVALYGATSGEAFLRGVAGERFCVRNSGAHAVVEGVGDHGCEYMTGGRVVVLGATGRNFAAGMSGGIAYVLDEVGDFDRRCNRELVDLEALEDAEDIALVLALIRKHSEHTQSNRGAKVLAAWDALRAKFVKVMPRDYRRVRAAQAQAQAEGREPTWNELLGVQNG